MKHLLSLSRESLTKKASLLRLSAGVIAENLKSGGFKSLYRGNGVEFFGVREYLHGDDVRFIDWNVTARMGRPFVKVFNEEREMQIFLIVDRSASMFFGSNGKMKYKSATEAAALLSIAAELNDSPVGAVFFDGKIHFASTPESGRRQTMKILSQLDEVGVEKNGSVLSNAITGAVKMLRGNTLVFVITDFRSANWEEPFKLLSQKNDVVALHITDPTEMDMPEIGSVPFADIETHERRILFTRNSAFKSAWKNDFKKRSAHISDFCLRHGASYVHISTQDDPAFVLSGFFAAKRRHEK
ncbi:MAG: DUF58 domain-containing protein [Treponema sp.]|nr:DUF58 domain-containing protein [Treponema sp.]